MPTFGRLINQRAFLPIGTLNIKAVHCCFELVGSYSIRTTFESFSN